MEWMKDFNIYMQLCNNTHIHRYVYICIFIIKRYLYMDIYGVDKSRIMVSFEYTRQFIVLFINYLY